MAARLLQATHAAVGLTGVAKERFNVIAQELSALSTQFSNNLLDATKAYELVLTTTDDVAGLPPSLLQLSYQTYQAKYAATTKADSTASTTPTWEQGPWLFSLEAAIVQPFLENCQQRQHRENLYKAYVKRASEGTVDNLPILEKIRSLRAEMAQLLGYHSYAELSIREKMVGSVGEVLAFEQKMLDICKPLGEKEKNALARFAKTQGFNDTLRPFDIA